MIICRVELSRVFSCDEFCLQIWRQLLSLLGQSLAHLNLREPNASGRHLFARTDNDASRRRSIGFVGMGTRMLAFVVVVCDVAVDVVFESAVFTSFVDADALFDSDCDSTSAVLNSPHSHLKALL